MNNLLHDSPLLKKDTPYVVCEHLSEGVMIDIVCSILVIGPEITTITMRSKYLVSHVL